MIEIKSRNMITAEASLGVCFLRSLFTSCYCFVLICVHNGVVSSCVALPGTWWPSSNLPRRKGPVCRHRAQIWPPAAVLVRQTKPSRGPARLRHQVSIHACPPPARPPSDDALLCSDPPLSSSSRYAITVWYFDADERARAKEKYLTGRIWKTRRTVLFLFLQSFCALLHYLSCVCVSCAGAGEKGVKVELDKPSDPS